MKNGNNITLCMAYYENPGMLQRQYEAFAGLPADLREHLSLVLVDDGSPSVPASPPASPIDRFKLFRMGVDIPWNQDACRNIAVKEAETKWVLLTDIDHLVPEITWRRVVAGKLSEKVVYKFSRVSAPDMEAYKPHPNSWLMTRGMYDACGGYDERFAGWYGTDGDFRNRVMKQAPIEQLREHLIRIPREVVPDASTTTIERKTPETHANLDRIKAERAGAKDKRPKRGLFPYSRVA